MRPSSRWPLALGVSACGNKQAHPNFADANNNGGYVDAGPITYQLQISRVLNPYSAEDSGYVKGLPPGTAGRAPTRSGTACSCGPRTRPTQPQVTTDNFKIVDTQGNTLLPDQAGPEPQPIRLDRRRSCSRCRPNRRPNTTASEGPTQGGLVLFKINNTAYANRPLTLLILGRAATGRAGSRSTSERRTRPGRSSSHTAAGCDARVSRWAAILGRPAALLALCLVGSALVAPGAQAGWTRPFQLVKPGTMDVLPTQLAFSSSGRPAADSRSPIWTRRAAHRPTPCTAHRAGRSARPERSPVPRRSWPWPTAVRRCS